MGRCAWPRALGYTLVELMVVVVIAAILLSLGMPRLKSLVSDYQLRGAADDLFAAINLTRSQALSRGQRVMLAPPDNTDWRTGWVVFVDLNGNQQFDAADELIFQQESPPPGVSVQSAFSSGQAAAYVAYNGGGRTCSASNSLAARWGTLSLAAGGQRRNIIISMLGRARICDPLQTPASCGGVDDGDRGG